MQSEKRLEHLQFIQNLLIWGLFIFGALAGLCGAGIKIYDNRIKEEEKRIKNVKEASLKPSAPSIQNAKNIYNISGDMVMGDKKVIKPKTDKHQQQNIKPNISINIADTNLGPNPYFTYDQGNLDFHLTIYAVNNAVAVARSLKIILIRLDEDDKPLEFKIFEGTSLPEKNLIYSNSPLNHTQKMGNLVPFLMQNLYISIDIVLSDEDRTTFKNERYIYRIKTEDALKRIPEISKEKYKLINDYLNKTLPKEV